MPTQKRPFLGESDEIIAAAHERLLVNSAGDWGPSKPTAVPDFIPAMRLRGHPESLIRQVVHDNPIKFFSGSRNFDFTPPEVYLGEAL